MTNSENRLPICCERAKTTEWGYYKCENCGADLCYFHIVLWNNKEPRCFFCFSETKCITSPLDVVVINNSEKRKPKTALIVLDGLYIAGMQRHVLDQISVLDAYGYSVILITVDGAGGRWADKFLRESQKIVLDVRNTLNWNRMSKIVENQRVDIAIGHLSNPIRWIHNNIPRSILAYAHFHTDPSEFEVVEGWEFLEYCDRFEKILFPSSVTLSLYAKLFLNGNSIKYNNKIMVLPNSLPKKVLAKSSYQAEQSQELRIAIISRLDKDKISVTLLFETLLTIARERKDFIVYVAGGGELYNEIQKGIQKYGLGKEVKMLGFVDSTDEIYQWADVVFLPSIRESMPYVLLESFSFGKPIIAPRVGVFKDLVPNDKIRVFEPEDSGTAAELIMNTKPTVLSAIPSDTLGNSQFVEFTRWSKMLASVLNLEDYDRNDH